MMKLSMTALVLSATCAACSSRGAPEAPTARPVGGWFLSGPRAAAFRATLDDDVRTGGRSSAKLACVEKGSGSATLMQSISAEAYAGKRVRFSANVRTDAVDGWTGLWMRVDRPYGKTTFDNMQTRPIRGTSPWARASVVLDVAADATSIAFGVAEDGCGTSWVDDAALEIVGAEVPSTAIEPYARTVTNAEFEAALGEGVSGWHVEGIAREDYEARRDVTEKHGGAASAMLVNRVPEPSGQGVLLQDVRADDFAGTRVRVTAWVKGKDLERGGRFWALTYGPDSGPLSPGLTRAGCSFEGTFAWRKCEGVLDVPQGASILDLGLALEGKGTAWIDDVTITPVGLDVPLTEVDRRARAIENGDAEEPGPTPKAWFLSGGARAHYEAVVDREERHGGRQSARLSPRVKDPRGYGTMMQAFAVSAYRGKRLRMNAWVKGREIDARGDMWLRVQASDSPGDGGGLGGGMCGLSGTFDWKPCTIVFDVPERGDELQLGVGLAGHGTIWLDDMTIEVVDRSVPLTHDDFAPRETLDDGGFEGEKAPAGWLLSGGGRKSYAFAIDVAEKKSGRASVRLAPAEGAEPKGYGTLMTAIDAGPHRGKRMRMTAQVKGRGVSGRGDVWLRVQSKASPADGPGLGGGGCALSGDFDWKPCTIVFDVPEAGDRIELGVGLGARGTLWLDDVALEEVPAATPTTAVVREKKAPENLGFE